jgi:hypothetical protein
MVLIEVQKIHDLHLNNQVFDKIVQYYFYLFKIYYLLFEFYLEVQITLNY